MLVLGLGLGLFISLCLVGLSFIVPILSSTSNKFLKFLSITLSLIIILILWNGTEVRGAPPQVEQYSYFGLQRLLISVLIVSFFISGFLFLFVFDFAYTKRTYAASSVRIPPYSKLIFPEDEEFNDYPEIPED
ncbi:hypothetical protein RCL1_003703 [Eukaryota sp. TZLM3-RCL]